VSQIGAVLEQGQRVYCTNGFELLDHDFSGPWCNTGVKLSQIVLRRNAWALLLQPFVTLGFLKPGFAFSKLVESM
jgi:hypothetical protein